MGSYLQYLVLKVLKRHTRALNVYKMKEIYPGYRILATREGGRNSSEAKSNMPNFN